MTDPSSINYSNTSRNYSSNVPNASDMSDVSNFSNMSNVKQEMKRDNHEVTFMSLSGWYKHLIEKLGWVILCRHDKVKVNAYTHSLDEFLKSTSNRQFDSKDKQKDLEIMRAHIEI